MVTPWTTHFDASPVVDPRAARRTTRALRTASRRGHVLGLVEAHGVDVVLTSHGPLALHPVYLEDVLDPLEVVVLADAARRSAGRGDAALVAAASRHRAMPVVVAWGRVRADVPRGGRVRHDVMFVRGTELTTWLHHDLTRGTTWSALDAAAVQSRVEATQRHDVRRLAG